MTGLLSLTTRRRSVMIRMLLFASQRSMLTLLARILTRLLQTRTARPPSASWRCFLFTRGLDSLTESLFNMRRFGLKKVIMSTYQAASGAGQEGMDELRDGAKEVVNSAEGTIAKNKIFAHPLPFNLIPHIDVFQDNLYTKEEMKVTWECRKIMDIPSLPVSCTAVRIPTFRAHAESIVVETEKPIKVDEARDLLAKSPGIALADEPANKKYPMPLTASKKYPVEVGRIRQNIVFGDHGLEFFVCGDQLLRGAALNAVLIAEALAEPVGKDFTPKL
uniref:Semialdehyde dehydrogenase dimerisation domain-containing protein n=1 Tax=Guillardia theta TaxID=55529 RepID=A0A7S4NM34_GUITH|mmetsp:Transcript_24799/g.81525  ORF Transcript_24799/g.81525 Transcript_24799/m.81525 type:complete len:276 (+) Transcript_24799:554-1381(+)